MQDINDLVGLELQLREAQKMEAIGRLAGGAAHDFNHLLSVIIGGTDLGISELRESDADLRGYFEMLAEAGDRASALTQQLLALGRRQVMRLECVRSQSLGLGHEIIYESVHLFGRRRAFKRLGRDH